MRLKEMIYGLLKRLGASRLKKKIWDLEFSDGKWDYLEVSGRDVVHGYIKKYLRGGDILDLGCGSGKAGLDIEKGSYARYTGVDISEVAVKKAARLAQDAGRGDKNSFHASDIGTFTPEGSFDVVLMMESIYYIPASRVKAVLERYSAYLKAGGVFIVRIWDRRRYGRIISVIRENFSVKEEYLAPDTNTIVLVFGR